MSVVIPSPRSRAKRDAFRDLVHLLWQLRVTQYMNIAMVSDAYHLSVVPWDFMDRFGPKVKVPGPRKV